jgi:hypothetical protein
MIVFVSQQIIGLGFNFLKECNIKTRAEPNTCSKIDLMSKEKRSWDDSVMLTKHNMEWGKNETDEKIPKRFLGSFFF